MLTKRLFVGIGLSPLLAKRLEREMAAFEAWPVIPTRRDNLHVTILFLGFVAAEHLPEILPAVERAALSVPAFDLSFDRIGCFPDAVHPTSIFLFGQDHAILLKLRQRLDQELGYLVPDKKSFRPHVTLGKIRRGKFEALTTKPSFEKTVNFIEPVSGISVFESTSVDGKRVYVPLAEFPLGV